MDDLTPYDRPIFHRTIDSPNVGTLLKEATMRKTIEQISQAFQGDRQFNWKEIAPAFYGSSSLFEAIEGVLVAGSAAKQNADPQYPPVTRNEFEGAYKDGTCSQASVRARDLLKSLGFKILYQDVGDGEITSGEKFTASTEDAVIRMGFSQKECSITVSTTNEAIRQHIHTWAANNLTEEVRAGTVYVLSADQSGLVFEPMGYGGSPLNRENYTPEVLVAYDRLLKELSVPSPHGRLSVLEGPPGSGKTYLIRALLEDLAEDVTLALVPASLVEQLVGPTGVGSIMKFRTSHPHRPLVFILEDADLVLAPRSGANMSLVSSLLNMGDGIMGATLDIRIIATTNATQVELDSAVKRPGRLSVLEHVGALSAAQATTILHRLTKDESLSFDKQTTLAEIYQKAFDLGFKPPKPNDKKIGFA